MPKYLTNTTFFNDGLGTYIANGVVQTNKVISNGDIVLTGEISNGSNSITFDETTLFTNIPENIHIYGTGYIDFQGTTYNIGELLSAFVGTGQISPYPSITYNSTTGETTFTGLLVFPNLSIASGAIINNDFLTYSTNQNVSGQKTFSGTQIFSSIQVNGDLIVNAGGTTITNANLQKIQYISGITSDLNTRLTTDETNITALQTKTTNMTFGSNITTFTGTMVFPTGSISFNAIVGTACTLGQTQTITGTKTFSVAQTFQNNIRLDGSLLLSSGTITLTNANLQKIALISDLTSSAQQQINSINTNLGNYITETELNTALSPINSNISTLQTNTQYISSTSLNTTILNTLNLTNVVFTGSLNTIQASFFSGINGNIQQGINNAQADANDAINKANNAQTKADSAYNLAGTAQGTASSALALAGTAQATGTSALALAGSAQATANTANSGLATLNTTVDGIEVDVATLQVKTTQMSYNTATSRTTIDQTLYSPNLEIGNLTSGFTQTVNQAITLEGILTCKRAVNIEGTLYLENNNSMIIEGIINQNTADAGTNLFQAPVNMYGNVIITNTSTSINATTTQIGTSAVSNFNCNSTASFGGDISMLASKNLRLRNIVPLLGDDVYFGEGQFNIADDVVFNMKMIANQSVNINNTFQVGTTLNRNTLTAYNTTTLLDANTGMTLTAPSIFITTPLITIGQAGLTSITLNGSNVYIGQLLGVNYLYGTTYVQNLYSATGVLGMAGQVFQQFV